MPTSRIPELERQGFVIVEQREDAVLAVRRRFHWDLLFSLLVVVAWIQRVDTLRADRVRADEVELMDRWAELDPGSWPPGLQKARLSLTLYLADEVEDEARELLQRHGASGFARISVRAALLGDERIRYGTTPVVGVLLYQVVEHLLERLREPPQGPERFHSSFGAAYSVFLGVGCGLMLLAAVLVVLGVALGVATSILGLVLGG